MLIPFDHGTPRGLASALPGHTVITAKARGWDRLSNGALLNAAEAAAVGLLVTTDRRIRYQRVQLHLERIAALVSAASPGSYTEVDIPLNLPGQDT
jgi:hypothetical protein